MIVKLPFENQTAGKIVGVERMEDTRRTWLTESTKLASYGLIETEEVSTGSASVYTRLSVYMFWLLAWWFLGLLTARSGRCVSVCS